MPTQQLLPQAEIDPINDVRREFERYYTEDYFYPGNGDWMSDDYYRVIDLTTKRGELTRDEAGKLERSIQRLNNNYSLTERRLGETGLLSTYNNVADQINRINSNNPRRADIPQMQSAPTETNQAA